MSKLSIIIISEVNTGYKSEYPVFYWYPGQEFPPTNSEYNVFVRPNDILPENISSIIELYNTDIIIPGIKRFKQDGGYIAETWSGCISEYIPKFQAFIEGRMPSLEGMIISNSLLRSVIGNPRHYRWETLLIIKLLDKCNSIIWWDNCLFIKSSDIQIDEWILRLYDALSIYDIIEYFKDTECPFVALEKQFLVHWNALCNIQPNPELFSKHSYEYMICSKFAWSTCNDSTDK